MFNVLFSGIEIPLPEKEKSSCVLEYARTQSNKTMQQAFVREFAENAQNSIQIWIWYKKLKEKGCLCRAKEAG